MMLADNYSFFEENFRISDHNLRTATHNSKISTHNAKISANNYTFFTQNYTVSGEDFMSSAESSLTASGGGSAYVEEKLGCEGHASKIDCANSHLCSWCGGEFDGVCLKEADVADIDGCATSMI